MTEIRDVERELDSFRGRLWAVSSVRVRVPATLRAGALSIFGRCLTQSSYPPWYSTTRPLPSNTSVLVAT